MAKKTNVNVKADGMTREGGLAAPFRHPLDWENPDFVDSKKIDAELRRVFDICHGCRRCFNLCDVFPRLFDVIDESPSGELDSVDSADFGHAIEACTLCDMCFMTKCPYVPPHDFNLDFPHLMLRYRAAEFQEGAVGVVPKQLARTDRNGKLARPVSGLVNRCSDRHNSTMRAAIERIAGIHRDAALPRFCGETFAAKARKEPVPVNEHAPAFGRKAVLYSTCFVNYNNPDIGLAARAVLARNGVTTETVYPECCGMPRLEHGDIAAVAESARKVAGELRRWIDEGYSVIALVPSCALMLKFEWPLILPDDENIRTLSHATADISEYVVDIARTEGLAQDLSPLDGGVSLHLACHARAQNMGAKAANMLRLIPDVDLDVIERCSGHGGSWGVMKNNFEVGLKIGKPVARRAANARKTHVASECPLAGEHIAQGMERIDGDSPPVRSMHPIQLLAMAYGIESQEMSKENGAGEK
ncbi:MAG: (Fe-S)-binding protein [Sphingomonadales bacterium]